MSGKRYVGTTPRAHLSLNKVKKRLLYNLWQSEHKEYNIMMYRYARIYHFSREHTYKYFVSLSLKVGTTGMNTKTQDVTSHTALVKANDHYPVCSAQTHKQPL
jgi:hypothetical protein